MSEAPNEKTGSEITKNSSGIAKTRKNRNKREKQQKNAENKRKVDQTRHEARKMQKKNEYATFRRKNKKLAPPQRLIITLHSKINGAYFVYAI